MMKWTNRDHFPFAIARKQRRNGQIKLKYKISVKIEIVEWRRRCLLSVSLSRSLAHSSFPVSELKRDINFSLVPNNNNKKKSETANNSLTKKADAIHKFSFLNVKLVKMVKLEIVEKNVSDSRVCRAQHARGRIQSFHRFECARCFISFFLFQHFYFVIVGLKTPMSNK